MKVTTDGKRISDCFAFASRVGIELVQLSNALKEIFADKLKRESSSKSWELDKGRTEYANDMDDSGWLFLHETWSYPLKAARGTDPQRFIGFQISLSGPHIAIPGNFDPLIHVFCWSVPVDFKDSYIAFPFDPDEEYAVIDERLMLWGSLDAPWNKKEWNYSVKLMALNTPADLETYIVDPALALLNGKNVADAISIEWLDDVVIRYPENMKQIATT